MLTLQSHIITVEPLLLLEGRGDTITGDKVGV